MKFKQIISSKNPQLQNIPSGYKRLGNVIFLRSQKNLEKKLGEAILDVYSWCEGVFQYVTTEGESRKPKLNLLAGSNNTEIEHKENGLLYVFDFSKVMFSGGNSGLRMRLIEEVTDGEMLVDMFAAIGNLSLQVLYYRKINAILIEKDPITFSYLHETIKKNGIEEVKLINKDCREVDLQNVADRIFMGYHDLDRTHMESAVRIAKSNAILHLHPIAKIGYYQQWEKLYSDWLNTLKVEILGIRTRRIKHFSPGLDHIEIMISIRK